MRRPLIAGHKERILAQTIRALNELRLLKPLLEAARDELTEQEILTLEDEILMSEDHKALVDFVTVRPARPLPGRPMSQEASREPDPE